MRDDARVERTGLRRDRRGHLTPQYNWGYPAALKNAIDHLYREWQGKPVLLITYGGHGGGQCGAQLRIVMGAVGARLTDAMPGLLLARERIVTNDGQIDPAEDFSAHVEDVKSALAELAAAELAALTSD